MNIQELSVGDWVRVISDNIPVKVIGIREVYSGCTEVIAVSDTTQYMLMEEHRETRYRKFEPIPLTPEILEKNYFVAHKRFNETYEYTTLLGTTLRQCIITKYNSKQFNVLTVREEDTKKEGNDLERASKHLDLIIPEVYVHHLQHAFRIIHPDKEIQIK